MKFWQFLGGLALVLILTGCNATHDANEGAQALAVTGTVAYRDRSALPENAVVTVTLGDASRQDVAMTVISQVSFPAAGNQSPFSFALPYTSSQIANHSRIVVAARIDLDGQLLYISTRVYEVVTNGVNNVNIDLERVGA